MIYKHIKMSVLNNNILSNSDTDNIMPELEYNIFYSNITWEITDIKNILNTCIDFLSTKPQNLIYLNDIKIINLNILASDILSKLPKQLSKNHLYYYIADYFANKIKNHFIFDYIASYFAVKRLHDTTNDKYHEVIHELYHNKDRNNNDYHLINEELYMTVLLNKKEIQKKLDYSRDYLLDFFAIRTLERSYLLRSFHKKNTDLNTKVHDTNSDSDKEAILLERPQHLFMRVALAIWGVNLERVFETYDNLSLKYFTHATPTLFNSGTNRQQMSSCFLLGVGDNIEAIFKTITNTAYISKWAGGIGIHLTAIRAKGSLIRGTNGKSDGIIPLCVLLEKEGRYINQGGKRNGSIALYLEPWHSDVFDFIELRQPNGDENMRARDLFLALWTPDILVERVLEDGIWSLMCPDQCPGLVNSHGEVFEKLYLKYEQEGKFIKQIRAMDLWNKIIECQIQSGMPYLLYKDHANNKSNQKNLGTIRSSNLCVAGSTNIITDKGIFSIKSLVDTNLVNIWNGYEFSSVEIKKTGTNQKLIDIEFSNGEKLSCTEYHKFYIENIFNTRTNKIIEKRAIDLNISNKIIQYNMPLIEDTYLDNSFKYPYMHGLFCALGYYNSEINKNLHNKHPIKCHISCQITLHDDKLDLLKYLTNYNICDTDNNFNNNNEITVELPNDIEEKTVVPYNSNKNIKLRWFEGLCDGAGYLTYIGEMQTLHFSAHDYYFAIDVKKLLNTLGVECIINDNMYDQYTNLSNIEVRYKIIINNNEINKLFNLGFKPNKLNITKNILSNKEHLNSNIQIKKITNNNKFEDTYCFTEPKRNYGVFNGILTGQCAEVIEYSDDDEIAVCNLASICLPQFIKYDENNNPYYDFNKLLEISSMCTRNLNRIIDINYYPVQTAKSSNAKNRPIGIGIQGLVDVYNIFGYSFGSEEAKLLNKKIFETIYYGALKESNNLAKEYEPYETFAGSPMSEGKLQYHLWGIKDEELLMGFDWKTLIQDIKKYGVRNSLLTALMPTASTAQIMGNCESFEPYHSNIFVRETLAGEFIVVNKNLMRDLIKEDIWSEKIRKKIIIDNGSIQNITEIPQKYKDIYKTAFEIKLKDIIDQSADRGIFIDQSQSLNLFMGESDRNKLHSAHIHSWKRGLKTAMYYLRSRPASDPINFGLDIEEIKELKKEMSDNKDNKDKICKWRPGIKLADCMMCAS